MEDSRTPASLAYSLHLVDQLCFAIYSTMLALNKLYQSQLKGLELTYPQYLVMLVLWDGDGVTVSDIGQRLFLDSSTLTPLLKRLEASGLIQRQRSDADQRQVIVTLTAAGRDLRDRARGIPECVGSALNTTLEEAGQLRVRLETLRSTIHSAGTYHPR